MTEHHRWLYPLLWGAETIGVAIIFWNGVPLYQQLSGDPNAYPARLAESRIWAFIAIALINGGYWVRYYLRPVPMRFYSPVLAHIMTFAGRMAFALATTVFGFVFLGQRLAAQMPWQRYVLTLVVLFSLFLYMMEMLYLGRILEDKPTDRVERVR